MARTIPCWNLIAVLASTGRGAKMWIRDGQKTLTADLLYENALHETEQSWRAGFGA